MKLKDFFEGLLQNKKANGQTQKTISEYRRLWNEILIPSGVPELEIDQLKKNHKDPIMLAGANHGKFGGQRGVVVFRQLLRYIRDEGYNPSVNWWEINLPTVARKTVEYLNDEEWEQVRSSFDLSSYTGLRDKALVEVLRATGMRIGEALALNRDQIPWKTKELRIKNGKPPYEEDTIYFTDECLKWLKLYLDVRNDKFPPAFASLTGRRASSGGVRRTITDAMRRAGIKRRIYPHLFRKTYCTELLFGNADIMSVKTLARHKSERTTMRYYTAVNKARCKDLHQEILNNPDVKHKVEFSETEDGQKVLIRQHGVPGVPEGIMTITHARILDTEEVGQFRE